MFTLLFAMFLLSDISFSLPFENPVMIFALVLFIILFAPILFRKINIPHIIGLIVAGIIIGPYGLNLLLRDSSIVLFGTVGLLYIMFIAALEIDLAEFRKNKSKIAVFGFYTFIIPITLGSLASYFILGFSLPSAILLASMFSTHTLVSYPIASRYGVTRNLSVTLTIGGTMITDILALLILAVITGMTKGDISPSFWITLGISFLVFTAIVLFIFPIITRWFFKKFDDSISQYIYVLAMVFLGSFLAEAAGVEAIIGAFISGLALNKFIPHSSALMNRIDFVGNALFIPFFLISVGMLVDVSVLFKGFGALKVAGVIIVVAIFSKFIAAWLTQKTFRLSKDERNMIFGLSNSHAAATLAIILVGYNIIIGETATGEPIRLLNEDVLNGTILLILVSCTVSSFVVEKASRNLALVLDKNPEGEAKAGTEKILISLAYPETVTDLVNFGLMLRPRSSNIPLYALHVVAEEEENNPGSDGKKMLEQAVKHAAATDNRIIPLTRFDFNISNAIVYTIKEQQITDIVIGLHHKSNIRDFLGPTTDRILKRTQETVFIYKSQQPFNTLGRIVVVVPPNAELEPGFVHWFEKLTGVAKAADLSMIFYAHPETILQLKNANRKKAVPHNLKYEAFDNWDDFLIFSRELKPNDLFIIISSRKGHVSFNLQLEKLPGYLTRYFEKNSFIIVYPKQLEHTAQEDLEYVDGNLIETISENMNVFKKISRLFKNSNKK